MTYKYSFKSVKGKNPNYFVHITCDSLGLEILADLPEEFTTAVGSEYESLLPSHLSNYFGRYAAAFEATSKVVGGTSSLSQALSQQIWVNSSPIELTLSLQFDAQSDPLKEVVYPMRALEMLVMPTKKGGILYSPGPNRGALLGGSTEINVTIGNHLLVIPNAIFISVSSTMDSRMTAEGYPISGKSDVQIRSSVVLSREDWAAMTGTTSALSSIFN